MFCTSGPERLIGRGSATDARVDSQETAHEILMDPSTSSRACQATAVPGRIQPISHGRGPTEWVPVGPLVC